MKAMIMKKEKVSNMGVTLLLLEIIFLTFSGAMECPYPEEVYPCRCIARITRLLFCGGPNITIPEIRTAVKAMGNEEFTLRVKNANLGKIDGDFFDRGLFREVHFEDCIIKEIDTSSSLMEYPMPRSILVLDIFNSLHGNVVINMFSLATITEVSLSNNVIEHLEIDWPNQPLPLSTIHLANNSIKSLSEDALAPLSFLNVLDMSRNRLQSLSMEMKPAMPQGLTMLDFSHNQISSISKYYFFNMMGLQSVSLSYNRIQILDEKTWKNLWPMLHYLNLQENPLKCGSEIKWIKGQQPKTLHATCSTPEDKKSKNLTEVIKENNPTESYPFEVLQRSSFVDEAKISFKESESDGLFHY